MEDWRRIDIDAFEPDKFLSKEELVPAIANPVDEAAIPSIIAECKAKLSKGQFAEALKTALQNPPYLSSPAAKASYDQLVFETLISVKNNNTDILPFVKQLSSDEQDTLVKYLYKIMDTSYGSKQGAVLLAWYEKTVEFTGLGPVIRFMSDRRTV
ncbi:arp2/3 complex subunit [Yamadazyma tenuis]|uniref:Actin-related protein 2/3 complex subunit 5 n=1 Tax=Candida tenuis (strain ATCC 10573 / BCRC 21748 / CBS 615 / JCM 9827 / NBRC 10315 / NRRL Y-1498 / VKM Y-70) TaxID=590646 RepID=G3BB49_CANTC|nr:ARP2/3 complex 16 kDa subunit (p16-Arc) [Yamadazyma tenuis ATCC 10573]XP_006688969.1 uncharacterized protein CANTEDRAFT_115610 [Yamadazyma tenuis ATCC 10573]EGV62798.1 ARP2/3 complex 16 kDa subunit (p16-Arc) [Yamadazyma tenuis ATCC 10573]EGV62799.1 hypothetical protein CANTEDRAFT_115610 [Yamadazyma tenuis ATCC 10573]WEJ93399.1 arp2/3 complex subunit [Yamadazyma tenuis]